MVFQSMLPVRGATQLLEQEYELKKFQSMLPVRGATCCFECLNNTSIQFQSMLPVRGATAATHF